MEKRLEEHKERGALVLTPQMGAWIPQAGLCGYGYNARANAVIVGWNWYPVAMHMGLN